MKLPRLILVTVALLLCAGCRQRDKEKGRFDGLDGGAPPLLEECNIPSFTCNDDCIRREATYVCTGCCRDQRLLCDTRQPHSFESCKEVR